VLLTLNAERAWSFKQSLSGGSTQVHLVPLDSSKSFKIIGDPLNPTTSYVNFVNGSIALTGTTTEVVAEYADNAAAITGGLSVGTHYRTGDLLKIVH